MEMGLCIRLKGIQGEVFLKFEASGVYCPVVISLSSLKDVLIAALYSIPFLSYLVIHPIDGQTVTPSDLVCSEGVSSNGTSVERRIKLTNYMSKNQKYILMQKQMHVKLS